jgi:hypothetical protein
MDSFSPTEASTGARRIRSGRIFFGVNFVIYYPTSISNTMVDIWTARR